VRVTSAKPPPEVPCPRCRRITLFSPQNPWRPFCSERCKRADFGAWASESYRVEADAPPDDDPQQPPPRGDH
jgi:hypothetical protein